MFDYITAFTHRLFKNRVLRQARGCVGGYRRGHRCRGGELNRLSAQTFRAQPRAHDRGSNIDPTMFVAGCYGIIHMDVYCANGVGQLAADIDLVSRLKVTDQR
jgi:hypothetical protein